MGDLQKTDKPQRGKLAWIEVGRGIAALSVVIAHFWRGPYLTGRWQFLSPEQFGSYGVEYFFVLSGFIICYVHRRDIGEPRRIGTYAFRRLTRILPTYYLVMAVSLLLNQTLSAPQFRHHVDLAFLLHQIFLLPGEPGLFIGVGWTLQHEFLFYGIFALAILSAPLGLIAFLGWMAAVAINFILNGPPPGQIHTALGILLLHYNLDFLIGACIALATIEGRIRACTIAMAGIALLIVLWILVAGGSTAASIFLLKAIFAALLCLAVILSLRGVKPWRPLVYLGALSYGLYLTHVTTEVIIHAIFKRTHMAAEDSWMVFFLSVLAALIAAAALYEIFEKPLMKWMHSLPWSKRKV